MAALRTSSAPVALPAKRDRSGSPRRRHGRHGRWMIPWLFLAPALAFFSLFKFWPSIWGVYLGLFHVRPYLGDEWVGLANFSRALTDPDVRAAVGHTVLDAAVQVAVAELWHALLYPGRYGAVNSLLGTVGLDPQPWLSSPHSSLWTVMLVQIWKHAPYDMVIFIAGLVGIDRQLYEQASIDGANAWQRLRAVTLPSLRPITTIVLILGMIRGLRVFTEIYVLTGGGPAGSTESIVTYVYKSTVVGNDAGYAAAISALL